MTHFRISYQPQLWYWYLYSIWHILCKSWYVHDFYTEMHFNESVLVTRILPFVPTTVVQLVDNTIYYTAFYGKRSNCMMSAQKSIVLWNCTCDSFRNIVATKVAHLVLIQLIWSILCKRKYVFNCCTQNCSFVKLCVWLLFKYRIKRSCALAAYPVYDTFCAKGNVCMIFTQKCILRNGACDSYRNIVPTTVVHLVMIKYITQFLKAYDFYRQKYDTWNCACHAF